VAQVAAEKAGILKKGAPAVSAGQPRAASEVLQARAEELGIPLWRPGRDYVYESSDVRPFCYQGPGGFRVGLDAGELALQGHHQRGNAALACALLQAAAERGLPVRPEHAREGLRTARWPARLEVVAHRPLVLLDGAHNPHAARALAHALPGLAGGRPVQLVFAAMSDKDHAAMLRELLPIAGRVHLCAVDSPRAAAPEQLAEVARELGADFATYRSVGEALRTARAEAGPDGCVVCCGSLYLAAEVAAALGGRSPGWMPSERL